MLSTKLIEYLSLSEEDKLKIDPNSRKQYAFQIRKKAIGAINEMEELLRVLPDKQQEMIFINENGEDKAELLIYSLLGFNKLEHNKEYSIDELDEILGKRRFKLLAKLYYSLDNIVHPRKSVLEQLGKRGDISDMFRGGVKNIKEIKKD